MSTPEHPRLPSLDPLVRAIGAAASAGRTIPQENLPSGPAHRSTLRPAAITPLWNELATECAANLVRHGDKARLGRILGLSRQRIHQLLIERTACADAERMRQLLVWLANQRQGREAL